MTREEMGCEGEVTTWVRTKKNKEIRERKNLRKKGKEGDSDSEPRVKKRKKGKGKIPNESDGKKGQENVEWSKFKLKLKNNSVSGKEKRKNIVEVSDWPERNNK